MIGRGCTIGHGAIVHGAVIGDGCLIGMHATLLDGAEIGEQQHRRRQRARAADAGRTRARSLLIGTPAKVARELTDEDLAPLRRRPRPLHGARPPLRRSTGWAADLSAFRR